MTTSQTCTSCNNEFDASQVRCPQCHQLIAGFTYKSRVAAAALALFGGVIGLHRFYLKQWRALLYIVFCWTPFPFIIAIIESVVFLASSQESWNKKYNQGVSAGRESGKVLAIFIGLGVIMFAGALSFITQIPNIASQPFKTLDTHTQLAEKVASAYQDYVSEHQRRPDDISQLTLTDDIREKATERVRLSRSELTVSFSVMDDSQQQIIMTPVIVQGEVLWDCTGSTLPAMMLPRQCR